MASQRLNAMMKDIDGKMVKRYDQSPNGRIIDVPFPGGLFHDYCREKLAA